MIYIDLKTTATHRLSFYLAMEEYVARSVYAGEDCFFMWQVEPTVIFGRNQVAENEVDLAYCRTEGIDVFRRKSGGGCVYADMSNVMLSYITREDDLTEAFDHYLALLTAALQRIGIPAVRNDHNDVMLGGHKISGNAIWHLPGRTIAHGTLLYDTRMEHMTRAITPGKQKLDKNGVQSVAQRTSNGACATPSATKPTASPRPTRTASASSSANTSTRSSSTASRHTGTKQQSKPVPI